MSNEPGPCPVCHFRGGFHDNEIHKEDSDTIPAYLKRFSKRRAARHDLGGILVRGPEIIILDL